MTRGLIDEIESPVPIGTLLPAVYQDLDPNVMRMTEAFDAVIAPVWMVLDNLSAYFDPALAPPDFVSMLAQWVGLPVDHNWSDDQMRRLVAEAVETYRWRGTRRGVIALVQAYTGVTPEVIDTGGTIWSATPGAPAPGAAAPSVRVRMQLPSDTKEDIPRLTRLIAETVPAHVPVTVEVDRVEVDRVDPSARPQPPKRSAPPPPPPPPAGPAMDRPPPRRGPPPPPPGSAPADGPGDQG